MGLAWCRERVESAHDSKSPVDRLLIRCNKLIKPRRQYSRSHGKVANEFVYKGMRTRNLGSSYPIPIHSIPPRGRHRPHQKAYNWKQASLPVGEPEDFSRPPVPPPRKKKKKKMSSADVLNCRFPELRSPGYVKQSENLRNKNRNAMDAMIGTRVSQSTPASKSFWKERKTFGRDRFEKSSNKRMGKINKAESRGAREETTGKGIKKDGEKRWAWKIKHVSTVSLPNYSELIKRNRKVSADAIRNGDDKNGNQSAGSKLPRRNVSAISLPGEGSNSSMLSSLSEATIHCLDAYVKRCRSFGSLKPHNQFLDDLDKVRKSPSESSDSSWCGLDEWDLSILEDCESAPAIPTALRSKPAAKKERDQMFFIGKDRIRKLKGNAKSSAKKSDEKFEIDLVGLKIPLEWFLDSRRRHPAITAVSTQEPPGTSPTIREDPDADPSDSPISEEHSSLLKILTRCEREESEAENRTNEAGDAVMPQKDSMNFDEAKAEFSLMKSSRSPLASAKNRSNSFDEEKIRRSSLADEKPGPRSPSNSFGCSTHLLRQLQKNKEAIEREILHRPGEMVERLRRESLFRNLPKDAFEAFEKKKMTSLRDSLNEFLGFTEGAKTEDEEEDEMMECFSDENAGSLPEKGTTYETEEVESLIPPESPPMGAPVEITINSFQKEEKNTLFPNALVIFKENV